MYGVDYNSTPELNLLHSPTETYGRVNYTSSSGTVAGSKILEQSALDSALRHGAVFGISFILQTAIVYAGLLPGGMLVNFF